MLAVRGPPNMILIKIFAVFLVSLYGANGMASEQLFDEIFSDCDTSTITPDYETTSRIKDIDQGCGWINDVQENRTESGLVTNYRKLPWQVSIYWITHGEDNTEIEIHDNCAGTIIHPRVVLTQPKYDDVTELKQLRVKAGDWNLQPTDKYVPQFSAVDSVAKIETRWFDINILFLSSSIERTIHVNYACLPSPNQVTEVSTNCLLEADHNYMGVAHQKPTKMLQVTTMDLEECRRKIRESQFLWTDVKLNSSWICVSNIEGHQNPCEGTDGTPLVCPYQDNPGRYYHAGILSWYSSCYFGDGYGIFKAVAHARKLIDEKIAEKGYSTDTYTP